MLPDPKDVEILRSGPRAWNAWRENHPSTVPELTGIALSLSERQMGPINGGPINLKSARLQGAFLRFATLSAADLEAADMSDADFMHARFDRANLSAANLSNAQLDHADLSGATLTKVDLCGASLQHAILSTTDLQAADMSGADLMHARFDRANLSAANLTNACLDYADFAGANLSEVNLCGASLQHAKNLTELQLEESTGSALTILPPHLQGSVSWSKARASTETGRQDFGPRTQLPTERDVSHIGSHAAQRWGIGALCIGVALVISAFVWQHMNEVVPLDTSPEALRDERAAVEDRSSPSVADTVDQTETTPEQRPAPETDKAGAPKNTNAKAELQASHDAKSAAESFASRELAAGTPEPGDHSALVSAESPPAQSQDAIVSELPAAAPPPDLQAAEQSAEAVAVNTPEQHLDASPPNYTALPPVNTALPSVDVTALPNDVEIVPKPMRKPVIRNPAGKPANQNSTTASPSVDVTIVPKPVRKPGIAGKPVFQNPVAKPVIQKPVHKPVGQSVIQGADVDSKSGQNLGGKRAEQKTGGSSTADLLAGGL